MASLFSGCDQAGLLVVAQGNGGRGAGPVEIVACGLSHHSAPVAVLERLAFTPEARCQALEQLAGREGVEAVILSTCNRVEIYMAAPGDTLGPTGPAEFLACYHGVEPEEIAPYLYTYHDEAAVRHLLQVATGLDSVILGEPQILGQVRLALEAAQTGHAAGPVLAALLRGALHTGKRVHSETGISQGAASVSWAAVQVAGEAVDLPACRALIVGAGKTGRLVGQCLRSRGVAGLAVVNRTEERARALADELGGTGGGLAAFEQELAAADIVISATDAPGYMLLAEQVRSAQAARAGRPLLLIDIAMPRDIEPAAAEVPGVRLFNLDDLHAVIDSNLAQRRRDGEQAQAIIDEETAAFMAWFRALAEAPLIAGLRSRAEDIRRHELEKMRNRLQPEDLSLVEMLTQRIVNQLLHTPTVRLKEHAGDGDAWRYTQALADLFGLEDGD